ncbi:MAG: succinate dehydrogenase, hydrophobic membrane anchor protein [Gammaproteobacteria bacterium]|nr:succinate dehydrogenase, hydrophobic membrane anchor protein [Gammaproteobacteria bacterium]MCP5136101.1 succinate dehydrogenase, hydrophobic membrane anchor protein [Gammaproteobacteria bacterium]
MSRQASGLQAWAVQRLTAIYLGGFFIYLIVAVLLDPPASVELWRARFGGVASVAWLLFVLALCWHAWIGIRDVVLDYIHPPVWRLSALVAFGGGLVACALWGFKIILLAAGG